MGKILRAFTLVILAASLAAAQPKSLFYMTESSGSVNSFLAHYNKIDIIVPTWYHVDKEGMLWGGPDPLVLETAEKHHVEIMPIVTGAGFGPAVFHQFLSNREAHGPFIQSLIRECKLYGYAGIQIDFENISWTDRDALSDLVEQTADSLHKYGYRLSIATVPNAPGYPGQTGFSYWIFRDWRNAYDLTALAKSVDMLCLMTYDQHTGLTPPGPVAGYPWTVENLNYAMKHVPKDKLMLGIPLYGYHWFAGLGYGKNGKPKVEASSISAPDAERLAQTYHAKVEWDPFDRTAWFYFYRADTREWVFYTDTRTFEARYNLVKERGLAGFCSWVLGSEDPGIWKELPSHK